MRLKGEGVRRLEEPLECLQRPAEDSGCWEGIPLPDGAREEGGLPVCCSATLVLKTEGMGLASAGAQGVWSLGGGGDGAVDDDLAVDVLEEGGKPCLSTPGLEGRPLEV